MRKFEFFVAAELRAGAVGVTLDCSIGPAGARDIGQREIVALKQQTLTIGPGQRIGEHISDCAIGAGAVAVPASWRNAWQASAACSNVT